MGENQEKRGWSRRGFLKGAGVAIGLPFFPSLFPRTAWADGVKAPNRLMFMSVPLGFLPNKWIGSEGSDGNPAGHIPDMNGWFPDDDGAEYKMPETHTALEPLRKHISFIKGLYNRKYRGDTHFADDVLLTCADTSANPARSFSNTISCDQLAAASAVMAGDDVRFPSLALGIRPIFGTRTGGMSWTASGVPISPMQSPAQVFDQLFGTDDVPAAVRLLRLQQRMSVLDVVKGQRDELNLKLNSVDRAKLDEVLTAVRGVEANIQREEKWINVPKPKVALDRPDEKAGSVTSIRHVRAMFDLAHAAFLTDSTRIITYEMPDVLVEVTRNSKHGINHNLTDPAVVKDANNLDREMSNQVAYFVNKLCESKEHDGQPLIQRTLAAYGSGVWGTHHNVINLPFMLIGHGSDRIKQGMTRKYADKTPLANLWLTMLKACDVPTASFADSTGTLDGLMS